MAATSRSRLLKERSARFFKPSVGNHQPRVGIRCFGIIDALHLWPKRRIFGLRISDIHRGPDFHQREKLWRCFAVHSDTAVCARIRVDKTLVKTVRGRKLAPITHRVTHVTASPASSGRNHPIALYAKPVRPRTFVLLLGVDLEIAFRRWF